MIAGVDGCRAGWVVTMKPVGSTVEPEVHVVGTFADVLALTIGATIVAIDIPIGLPARVTTGGRPADREARRVLGARQSSVFAIPSRAAVERHDYAEACRAALQTSEPPRKISRQAFNLFPRIREVDVAMTPHLQVRVRECHPELAFWAMNDRQPLTLPKKIRSRPYQEGLALRRNLLARAGLVLPAIDRLPGAGPDDLLDALACLWTAERIATGAATCVPSHPDLDPRGLRQEIWA